MRKGSNINIVLERDLCIGCGICKICPEKAIVLTYDDWSGYKPKLVEEKCVGCGLCLDLCPSYGNFLEYCKNSVIGSYLNIYLAYACDDKIRYEASSGGIVTTLLLWALEKNVIDGAILTKMSKENPIRTEVCVATTEREVLSCMGSKYNISPVGAALSQIKDKEGKFAVVGLPCHILAYKKAAKRLKLDQKIVFYIGLFCNHTSYPQATKFLLEKEGINLTDVESISYRGNGWPGFMKIYLKNGRKKLLPSQECFLTYFSSYFFSPLRCLVCNDVTAELADISVGDAWLPELKKSDRLGSSILITRSFVGEKLIKNLSTEGRICIKKLPLEKVIQSQKGNLNFKKINVAWNGRTRTLNIALRISRILAFINHYFSKNKNFYPILRKIPKKILLLYGKGIETLKTV